MALHPVNDRFKVQIDKDEFGFKSGDDNIKAESGIVVEIPDIMIYLSFHSFAFENSIVDKERLTEIASFYKSFVGKRIFWEALQDRGRMIAEEDGEYVYLQMTDLLAYADDVNEKAQIVDQVGKAGSFNLS